MNTGKLLEWFESSKRDLPWRSKPSVYGVWLSEVMSQQTTLAAVVPYYNRWMAQFGTVKKLAQATESQVLAAWAGLGYYSRARNIHKAAQLISKNGFPKSAAEWQQMPGVGPYTAKAIAAISFDEPVMPLDGNVLRVVARQHNILDPHRSKAHMARVQAAAQKPLLTVERGEFGALAEAMMELGARICRPGALAVCAACPVSSSCLSYQNGSVAKVPRPKKRPETIERRGFMVAYRNPCTPHEFMVRPVADGQRLRGQFELPIFKVAPKGTLKLGSIRQTITRHRDVLSVHDGGFWQKQLPKGHVWGALKKVHISTASRKALDLIFNVDSASKLGKST